MKVMKEQATADNKAYLASALRLNPAKLENVMRHCQQSSGGDIV